MHDGSGCKASSKINESHTVKYFNNFFLSKKKMDVSVNVTLIHHAQIQMNKKPCFMGERSKAYFCQCYNVILKFKFYKGGGVDLTPRSLIASDQYYSHFIPSSPLSPSLYLTIGNLLWMFAWGLNKDVYSISRSLQSICTILPYVTWHLSNVELIFTLVV